MEKKIFIQSLQNRTKELAKRTIQESKKLERNSCNYVITKQVLKSVTSTASNYRAACIARSKKEFYHKLSIVLEELDETIFWFELISELELIKNDISEINVLIKEAVELQKILSTSRKSLSQ